MLEQGKISGFQTIPMLINLVSATAVMIVPGITTSIAGRDAWITPILALIPTIYQAYLTGNLGKRFPNMTLIQYLEVILGTWIGKIIGILYIFFFLHTRYSSRDATCFVVVFRSACDGTFRDKQRLASVSQRAFVCL